MLILAPAALAQGALEGEDDVLAAEREAKVEHGELEQIAGQPLPKQVPNEPLDEFGGSAPKGDTLPKSTGVMTLSALLLPAAAVPLGSGVLGYAVLRRRK